MYSNIPGGEPGNDDLGALSTWYAWSAMGLHPSTPGTDTFTVTSPLFSSVKLNLARHHVTISAPGTGEYTGGLSVNGRPTQHTWLPGSLITGTDDCRGDTRPDFSLTSRAAGVVAAGVDRQRRGHRAGSPPRCRSCSPACG